MNGSGIIGIVRKDKLNDYKDLFDTSSAVSSFKGDFKKIKKFATRKNGNKMITDSMNSAGFL